MFLTNFESAAAGVFRRGLPSDDDLKVPAVARVFFSVLCTGFVADIDFTSDDDTAALQQCFHIGWLRTRESELISCLGVSLLMFCGTVWVLVFGRGRAKINKRMLSVAILLLLFSTTVSLKRLPNILDVSYSQILFIANYFRHNSPRRRLRITT
jgi:hypothetical protein